MIKLLYAPWRSSYSTKVKKSDTVCVFCSKFNPISSDSDEKNFILKRFDHSVAMLNLYPYNAGHILILPYRHAANLDELTVQERSELMEVVNITTEILKKALEPDGINIGLNLGKASGGSIPEHLHIHVIPRWWGDTNFLAITANTKQISFNMHDIYRALKAVFTSPNG